jgi:hypothetical protein
MSTIGCRENHDVHASEQVRNVLDIAEITQPSGIDEGLELLGAQ